MKINFFKTKKNFKKKDFKLNPNFYWKIIVCMVFLLTLSSFVFGYYIFRQIREESDYLNDNLNKKQLIDKEKLDQVLENFSLREQKSIEIINSPTPVVDPSL